MTDKKLRCVCCGGYINRHTMKCEYCGTEYVQNIDIPTIRYETFQNPVKEYTACELVADEYLVNGGEQFMENALKRLSEEMLPAIVEGMEVKAERDPIYHETKLYGRIKMVIPKDKGR